MMEMPCTCPGCGDVVELNDMHRDPCDPTRTGLVCRECAEARAAELDRDSSPSPSQGGGTDG